MAYQMTISHLPFLGGREPFAGKKEKKKQPAKRYLLCVGKQNPQTHSGVNSTLEENRAFYMYVFRRRVTVTPHPNILMAGTLFKPTTGEWQQTMTECLFSIVRPRKMIRHSPPSRFANKLLWRVLSGSNCSVPSEQCVFICMCVYAVLSVCLCEWTYRSSAIYFPELDRGS